MSIPTTAVSEAGVERRTRGAARQGEGAHPRARRAGRRTPPPADGPGREGVPLRGSRGRGQPARPVRGPPPADRLPLLPRPGHADRHLPRGAAPAARCSPTTCRTSPTSTRATRRWSSCRAGSQEAIQQLPGSHGLGRLALVHDRRRLRGRLRRRPVVLGRQRLPARRRRDLPQLLRERPGRRGPRAASGGCSTSRRSAARRSGRTRPTASRRIPPAHGYAGTTPTAPRSWRGEGRAHDSQTDGQRPHRRRGPRGCQGVLRRTRDGAGRRDDGRGTLGGQDRRARRRPATTSP